MTQQIKNTGFIYEEPSEEDFRFGAVNKTILIQDGDWTPYLPTGEKQKRNDVDKMACVTFSALNVLETLFTYMFQKNLIADESIEWLDNNGYYDKEGRIDFSDRFIAKISGTSHNGNSLKRVGEAIRKYGLIPEKQLPYRKNMTWNEFYSYIPDKLYKLGKEFLKHFQINYETIWHNEFDEALKCDPLQVAVHAWNGIKEGVYLRTSQSINHAVERHVKRTQENFSRIFDTYEEDPGDYIKELAADFIYMQYGYRYLITPLISQKKNMLETIKVKNQPEIYVVSPSNSKMLRHVAGWRSYQELINAGYIKPYKEIDRLEGVTIADGILGILL